MTPDFMKQQYKSVIDAQCKVQQIVCTARRHIVHWKQARDALVNVGRTKPTATDAVPPREERLVPLTGGYMGPTASLQKRAIFRHCRKSKRVP
jgi:hypothetical protein